MGGGAVNEFILAQAGFRCHIKLEQVLESLEFQIYSLHFNQEALGRHWMFLSKCMNVSKNCVV